MVNYGITKSDIISIDNKINFQKEYLKRFKRDFFNFSSDKDENEDYLNSCYSANLNPKKYFAEINNRVNSMVKNAKDKGLMPVFITITAPSKHHKRNTNGDLIISPNQTAKDLTQIWNKFTNLQVFQRLRDDGYQLSYFRVYEPHKSGVPHLHCMLFLPASAILEVKKKFYEYFTKFWGANIGGIGFRYTWYSEKGGAVGYIMKYILKTFKNEDDEINNKIEYSVYWYIKHRVIRFLSSRSLANLSLYRKIRYYFKNFYQYDLIEIKRLIDNNFIFTTFDNTVINYRFFDDDGELQEDIIWAKNTENVLNSRKYKDNRIHLKYTKDNQANNTLDVLIDGVVKMIYNKTTKEFKNIPIIFSKLSDLSLCEYRNTISKMENIDKNLVYLVDKEIEKRFS